MFKHALVAAALLAAVSAQAAFSLYTLAHAAVATNRADTGTSCKGTCNTDAIYSYGNTSDQTMAMEYGFGSDATTVGWTAAPLLGWTSPVTGSTAEAVKGNVAGLVTGASGTAMLNWMAVNWPAAAPELRLHCAFTAPSLRLNDI